MIGPDDSRLTTYVVDDVDPELRAEVEKALADSEFLAQEAAEIRAMGGLLTEALSQESTPELRPEQRRAIEAAASRPRRSARPWLFPAVSASIAATLVLLLGVALYLPTFTRTPVATLPVEGERWRRQPPVVPVGAKPGAPTSAPAYPPPPPPETTSNQWTVDGANNNAVGDRHFNVYPSVDAIEEFKVHRNGYSQERNTEDYRYRADNEFLEAVKNPLSTFSLDVDTASYANVRRFLSEGQLPPVDAVRIEEMVNYFPYAYEPPREGKAFAAHLELAPAPWNKAHRLLRVGLKARELPRGERPSSNLVFLIDVSGSMDEPNKLPLVRRSLQLLVDQLGERDRVAIVVYAGAAGCVLPPTSGADKPRLRDAIDRLQAGGSTNGAQGIELAYQLAQEQLIKGGVNRVILATDGDFNVGITDEGSLTRLIQAKAKSGVFLSVFGFGMGNLQDARLESLADKGNGNYGYIDSLNEARKALVEQMDSTLVTVAKDVKIQVEWNPTRVRSYRLIGYENRLLRAEEFNDDKKDAGEVGAGHSVTALYEIIPADAPKESGATVDPLVYQQPSRLSDAAHGEELMRLKLRYKEPEGDTSRLLEWPVLDRVTPLAEASTDFHFAAAVAGFGMLLRDSPHKGDVSTESIAALAHDGLGRDEHGYRSEFVSLVKKAANLPRPSAR